MATDGFDVIHALTESDYLTAFRNANLSDREKRLLSTHLNCERQTATARDLAKLMGYGEGRAINLRYGLLAKRVSAELSIRSRREWLDVLIDFAKPHDGDASLVLKKPVASALRRISDIAYFQITSPDARIVDEVAKIAKDRTINRTTRKALIDARLGMGKYRIMLEKRWGNLCAVTGCGISEVLRASHIKPWKACTTQERLNPANGLLLSAHIDALFDRGLISFRDDGNMVLSGRIGVKDRRLFGVPRSLRQKPTAAEKGFLSYHRRYVLD